MTGFAFFYFLFSTFARYRYTYLPMKKRRSYLLLLIFLQIGLYAANAQSPGRVKVSSYNLRYDNPGDVTRGNGWQNRRQVIAAMILFHDLDIVGTQECLHSQIVDLDSALVNYGYIGRGRDDRPDAGEHSAIFYKRDRYNLIDSGDFWLSETPEKPSRGWDAALNRICTWGCFEERATGFRFYLFNLHMDHIGVVARKESSKLVVEKIREIACNQPVCLTGDFNVDQQSEGYKVITSSGILSDAYHSAPIRYAMNGTFNAFHVDDLTAQRIDHVFVTSHFTPLRYGVLTDIYWTDGEGALFLPADRPELSRAKGVPRLSSDHFPVVVELQFGMSATEERPGR